MGYLCSIVQSLPRAHAQEFSRVMRLHLKSSQALAAYCWQEHLMCFKLRPKHHCLYHVAVDTATTRLNPNIFAVWQDEKWLGVLKNSNSLPWGHSPETCHRKVCAGSFTLLVQQSDRLMLWCGDVRTKVDGANYVLVPSASSHGALQGSCSQASKPFEAT